MSFAEVSTRVAWAVHQADPPRETREAIAAAVGAAGSFDELPGWVRDFVRQREAAAPPEQEWRRSGRLQLTRADLRGMSSAGINAAREQGRLRRLLAGEQE